jgi:mRNA-degrading endonuclease RelE of RelBE toxin-antitoxin system
MNYLTKRKFRVFASPDVLDVLKGLSNADPVRIKFDQVIDDMKHDKNLGDYIKRKPWPAKYNRTHEVSNLYRCEIGGNHRLIYTIRGRQEDKVYQLLDLLTHKQYDRLFGYSTT